MADNWLVFLSFLRIVELIKTDYFLIYRHDYGLYNFTAMMKSFNYWMINHLSKSKRYASY